MLIHTFSSLNSARTQLRVVRLAVKIEQTSDGNLLSGNDSVDARESDDSGNQECRDVVHGLAPGCTPSKTHSRTHARAANTTQTNTRQHTSTNVVFLLCTHNAHTLPQTAWLTFWLPSSAPRKTSQHSHRLRVSRLSPLDIAELALCLGLSLIPYSSNLNAFEIMLWAFPGSIAHSTSRLVHAVMAIVARVSTTSRSSAKYSYVPALTCLVCMSAVHRSWCNRGMSMVFDRQS
jgi:hypothetical protein